MSINNIVLNENAYFYKKEVPGFFSQNHIKEIFTKASSGRTGNYLYKSTNQTRQIDNTEIRYSFCVFKFERNPAFLITPVAGWTEIRLAYLLIIDYNDYALITKRNIFGVDDLLYKGLTEIDYRSLASLFVDDNTAFEKFSMNNTNISTDALRGKTVEAVDLKRSFSTFGSGRYVLSSLRVNNTDVKTTVVLNTSRIAKIGEKKLIHDLISWGFAIVEKLRNPIERNSFLGVFAEPIDYENHREQLRPISILFDTIRLHEDIERQRVISCNLVLTDGRSKTIPLSNLLKALNSVFDIEESDEEGVSSFTIHSRLIKDLELSLNKKSITLFSNRGSRIILNFSNGGEQSLIAYFNTHNDFIINFEDFSFVYTHRKLFSDSRLIGYINSFIDVFIDKVELDNTTSEKGRFTEQSTFFENTSVFSFIENHLTNDCDFSLLDDLGDEWADFIKLRANSISLIHAKHDTSTLSAKSFHEVVGQALKNLGNFNPTVDRLEGYKRDNWSRNYSSKEGINTLIPRLRNGDSVDNAINFYKSVLSNANLNKEVILVVDFISKSLMADRLEKLSRGENFTEKKQVIQILWIISSLINSCMENGVRIYIYCKP